MKNKMILIVLAICLGQFVNAQNKKLTQAEKDSIEMVNQIKKQVEEKLSLSPLGPIQGKRTYDNNETKFERDKREFELKKGEGDSLSRVLRNNDSILVIQILDGIQKNQEYLTKLKTQKRITKKDQKEIIELFLIILKKYEALIMLFDKIDASLAEARSAYSRISEITFKLIEERNFLIEENEKLKKENERLKKEK